MVTRDFLKKYLSFVKSQKSPEIDGDCIEYAAQLYSIIRQKAAFYDQNKVSCPVTVRTLETLIRLATAHSKLRLSKSVNPQDLDIALALIHLSIFGEAMDGEEDDDKGIAEKAAPEAPRTNRREAERNIISKKRVKFGEDEEMDEDFSAPSQLAGSKVRTRRNAADLPDANPAQTKKMKIDEEQQVTELFQSSVKHDPSPVDISVKKFVFKLISDISNSQGSSRVAINDLWQKYFSLADDA